ncbi:MAG: hypothetical protein KAT11_01755 [Phycisphaerae bacterium]|nr:hypothetical protein [Phycisphaerae bacterium]
MSPNREQIKQLIAQGRHQRALNALLDLLSAGPLLHDVHFAAHDGPIQFRANLDKLPADYADYLQVEER